MNSTRWKTKNRGKLTAAFPAISLSRGSMQFALVGLEQAGDRDIGQYVREHDYAIVTKDADCYDMSLMRGAPPYAIWLQAGNVDRTAF